jgi:Notch-like protein
MNQRLRTLCRPRPGLAGALALPLLSILTGCTSPAGDDPAQGEHLAAAQQAVTSCVTIQRGTLGAVEDTTITANVTYPGWNSTSTTLRAGGTYEALLRFDLSAIPSDAAVTSATLNLTTAAPVSNTLLYAHWATGAWSEATSTFAGFNQQISSKSLGAMTPSAPNTLQTMTLKASTVQGWVNGTIPNYGLTLETLVSAPANLPGRDKETVFVSSDSPTVSLRPSLQVCFTPVDHCAPAPCLNGAACTSGNPGYTCQCAPGFTGTNCEIDINDCAGNPCHNGGACVDGVNSYTCNCAPGFTGAQCQIDINECAPAPCQNGGTCADQVNGYLCTCPAGFSGTNCQVNIDDCAGNPCQNGGSCADGVNSYTCSCPAGFTGAQCQLNIDDCVGNACQNGSACVDGIAAYTCACPPGFSGAFCQTNIDDCAGNPCQNGGSCADGVNSYSCACAAGYTGTNCEIDVNDCAGNPCQNGGTCVDGVNSYSCTCTSGWSGPNCDVPVNSASICPSGLRAELLGPDRWYESLPIPATLSAFPTIRMTVTLQNDAGGDLDFSPATPPYVWVDPGCAPGDDDCALFFPGQTFLQFPPAVVAPGATFTYDVALDMTGAPATGQTLALVPRDTNNFGTLNPNQVSLVSITFDCAPSIGGCAATPCQNGAACAPNGSGYTCACPSGYSGTNCETVVCPCAADPRWALATAPLSAGGYCQNVGWPGPGAVVTDASSVWEALGGSCYIFSPGGADLALPDPTRACVASLLAADGGAACGACVPNLCQNAGQCTTTPDGGYGCLCAPGYGGANCEIDLCSPNPCQNGGTCAGLGLGDGYACTCVGGFTGSNCEVAPSACPCAAPEVDPYWTFLTAGAFGGVCLGDPGSWTAIAAAGAYLEASPGACVDLLAGVSLTGLDQTQSDACLADFAGGLCPPSALPCASNPCQNGGTCASVTPDVFDGVTTYTCACAAGWTGTNCDQPAITCPCSGGAGWLSGGYSSCSNFGVFDGTAEGIADVFTAGGVNQSSAGFFSSHGPGGGPPFMAGCFAYQNSAPGVATTGLSTAEVQACVAEMQAFATAAGGSCP